MPENETPIGRQVRSRPRGYKKALLFAFTFVLVGAGAAVAPSAFAVERGLAPTSANITGNGSYGVSQSSISGSNGFGGGTVYYPSANEQFPVVAFSPGFLESWSNFTWIGPRLASWGFVVVGINTTSGLSQPDSRGSQLLSALDWASNSSPTAVRSRVDSSRQGVAGHSMGGGGTLRAMASRSSIRAGVPITPYHGTKGWSSVRQPTLILGGQSDSIAPPGSHAIPFYNSLGSSEKGYLEFRGGDHFIANSSNPTVSKALVSWFKRFLEDDTRFSPFACDFGGTAISQFRNTCPV